VFEGNEWKEVARFMLRVIAKKPASAGGAVEPRSSGPVAATQPQQSGATPTQPEQSGATPSVIMPPDKAAPAHSAPAQSSATPSADPSSDKAPLAQTPAPQTASAPPATKRAGFDKLNLIPSITVNIKSQAAEAHFPASNLPGRATFTDVNLQATLRGEISRGLLNSQAQFDFAGASFEKEALRFAQLGERAPNVDLASYLTQLEVGKAKYTLGHSSYGTNRQLMNNFSSRGMTLSVPVTPYFDLSLAAMNGTNIVGYDNFLGLANPR